MMEQYYIYKITNLIDSKVYIGQHLSNKDMMIGDNYMGSGLRINNAINKYGIENFRRDILACTSTRENSDIIEKYYIGLARELYDCYNIADGGQGGNLGEEVNKKRIDILGKRVICVELDKAFDTIVKASKYIGLKSPSSITDVLSGKQKTAGGYHWDYSDTKSPYLKEQMKFNGDTRKKVLCVETNKTYESITEAARAMGLKQGSISTVLCGKQKTTGGHHWAYVDEENPYLEEQLKSAKRTNKRVYCIELDRVFNSLKDAAQWVNVSPATISDILHGNGKTVKGFHWKFIDEENPYLKEQLKPNKKITKKVRCIELNKTFDSMIDAAKELGLKSSTSIGVVLRGKGKTAGGYHWEFEGKSNPYLKEQFLPNRKYKKVLCVEMNKIYKGVREAARYIGLSHQSISGVLRGKQKTAGGYHWEYAD